MKEPFELTTEQLEAIAGDKSIMIPEGLEKDLSAAMNILDWMEKDDNTERSQLAGMARSLRFRRIISTAAASAVLIGASFGIYDFTSRPEDTFDDPYLAYQQLEETFALISSKVEKSAEMAGEAGSIIERTNTILNKTLN